MNKGALIAVVVIVLILGIFAWMNFQGNQTSKTASDQTSTTDDKMMKEETSPAMTDKMSDAKEIIVEGSNFKFAPNVITVKKGEKVRIVFKNTDGMHDFKIDELNVATKQIDGGEQDIVEFTPDQTGTFEYYCSVGQHRQMGMVGTLTVE